MLQESNAPLSAYDILGELRTINPKTAPTTIYRALATLTERGCVHRIESLNAYVACRNANHSDAPVMSICDGCGAVEECFAPDLEDALVTLTRKSGFAAKRHVIEVHGFCAACGTGGTPA